jgi:hypothetical protein
LPKAGKFHPGRSTPFHVASQQIWPPWTPRWKMAGWSSEHMLRKPPIFFLSWNKRWMNLLVAQVFIFLPDLTHSIEPENVFMSVSERGHWPS